MASMPSPPPARPSRKGWLLAAVIGVIAVIGAVTYSAGESDGPTASPSCEPVSTSLLDAIETGVTVSGGGSLSEGGAVRSADFERVWFVAAEIDGAGMEGTGEVGVWATNADPAGAPDGLIYAVNSMATEFSDWGSGPGFSTSDDGAAEAESCPG